MIEAVQALTVLAFICFAVYGLTDLGCAVLAWLTSKPERFWVPMDEFPPVERPGYPAVISMNDNENAAHFADYEKRAQQAAEDRFERWAKVCGAYTRVDVLAFDPRFTYEALAHWQEGG